jgi:hypothetical protein
MMNMADLYNKPLPPLPKPGAVPKSRRYVETTKTANKNKGTHNTGGSASGFIHPAYRVGSSTQGHISRSASQTARPEYYHHKPTPVAPVAPVKAKAKPEYYQQAKEEYSKPTKTLQKQQKLKASISRPNPLVSPEGRYPTNIAVERGGVGGPTIASWPRSPIRQQLCPTRSKLQKKEKKTGKEAHKTASQGSWRERLTATAGKLLSFSRKRSDSDASFGCQGLGDDYLAQVVRAKKRAQMEHAQTYADATERIRQAFVEEPHVAGRKTGAALEKSYTEGARAPAPLFSGPEGQYPRRGRWI